VILLLALQITSCGMIPNKPHNPIDSITKTLIESEKIEDDYARVVICGGSVMSNSGLLGRHKSILQYNFGPFEIFYENKKIVEMNIDESVVIDYPKNQDKLIYFVNSKFKQNTSFYTGRQFRIVVINKYFDAKNVYYESSVFKGDTGMKVGDYSSSTVVEAADSPDDCVKKSIVGYFKLPSQ
jgi:hypothetical protein